MGSTDQKINVPAPPSRDHIIRYPRLRHGSHFADFMRDKRLLRKVYHCIIQREGSNAILAWTQHSSLVAAMNNAQISLKLILNSTALKDEY